MNALLLTDQRILIVDDEPDVLTIIKAEIGEACPDCQLETATTYQGALDKMVSWTYDLVILDIMGVRGFDLLSLAIKRNFPVAMLTAHALSPEALKRSIEMGARAYLPKEKLGDFFNIRFGPDWQKPESKFWKDFNDKLETDGTSYVNTPSQKLGLY